MFYFLFIEIIIIIIIYFYKIFLILAKNECEKFFVSKFIFLLIVLNFKIKWNNILIFLMNK